MDFLGVGPLEVLFILVIALIIFGPKDIVKTGQATGRFLRRLMTSPGFQTVQRTSRELRNLPNRLVREAGLEDFQNDVNEIKTIAKPPDFQSDIQEELKKIDEGLSAWTSPVPLELPKEKKSEDESPAVSKEAADEDQ
jgi:Sec-independent protein translocase protein TatA